MIARSAGPRSMGVRPRRRMQRTREAFSLLEVVLALAILAGSIAVIGELVRAGARNAQLARDLTVSQLLCESKLAELAAGIEIPSSTSQVPFDSDPGWLYSIVVESLPQEGLLAVRVTVERKGAANARAAASVSLVRWMADPEAESSTTSSGETNSNSATNSQASSS